MCRITNYALDGIRGCVSWIEGHCNPEETYHNNIYFSFNDLDEFFSFTDINWREFYLREILHDYSLYRCGVCKKILFDDPHCEICDKDEEEPLTEEELIKEDIEEIFGLKDYYLNRAIEECFPFWLEYYEIDPLGEEMVWVINNILEAESGWECYAAILMLNNLQHCGGSLMEDYAEVDPDLIQAISEGSDNVFSEEEIRDFVNIEWRNLHNSWEVNCFLGLNYIN